MTARVPHLRPRFRTRFRPGLGLAAATALAGAMAVTLMAAPAVAQEATERAPTAEDRALATALFKEGRRLLEGAHVAEACRKFEESQRLDPSGGTMLNLAACYEREGRTASAWTEFSAALAQARRDGRQDRAGVAAERVAALEPKLSRLTIVVAPAAERADLEVTIDGILVRRPAWGVAMPVDAGEHVIAARAPGRREWSASVVVGGEHASTSVDVPALEPLPEPPPGAAPVTPPAALDATAPGPRASALRDGVMIGSAAIGVVGLGLGAYFGLHALGLKSDATAACPGDRCTAVGADASNRAATSADLSTASFAVGALGAGAAAYLFFTRPAPPPIGASVTARGATLTWSGTF